jgi:hypothetical protein
MYASWPEHSRLIKKFLQNRGNKNDVCCWDFGRRLKFVILLLVPFFSALFPLPLCFFILYLFSSLIFSVFFIHLFCFCCDFFLESSGSAALLLEMKTWGDGLWLIWWRFCDDHPLLLSLSYVCCSYFCSFYLSLFFFVSSPSLCIVL